MSIVLSDHEESALMSALESMAKNLRTCRRRAGGTTDPNEALACARAALELGDAFDRIVDTLPDSLKERANEWRRS